MGQLPGHRRLVVGVCLVTAASLVMWASYSLMLTPMSFDLDLTKEQAAVETNLPNLMSLLVVFAAGVLGDRLGHRRVIVVTTALFVGGSLLVAVSTGMVVLTAGFVIVAMTATVLSIVSLGMLGAAIPGAGARAIAFATYGMVSPAVNLVMPVLTGVVTEWVSWRLVAGSWALLGLAVLVLARRLFPPAPGGAAAGAGELWTPLLAGVAVLGATQLISRAEEGWWSPRTLVPLAAMVGGAAGCALLMRRLRSPSLSMAPLRNGGVIVLLVIVMLVPFANTLFYVTLTLQYMYRLDALQTALAMVPAQVAGIVGARWVAGPAMRRFGVLASGVVLLLALAAGLLAQVLVVPGSPAWVPVACSVLFAAPAFAVVAVVTNAVMSAAPDEDAGMSSAYRYAATSVGYSLGIVFMGAVVFGAVQSSLQESMAQRNVSAGQVEEIVTQVKQGASSPSPYALPPGIDPATVGLEAMSAGLRANGVAGAAASAVAAALFAFHRGNPWARRRQRGGSGLTTTVTA